MVAADDSYLEQSDSDSDQDYAVPVVALDPMIFKYQISALSIGFALWILMTHESIGWTLFSVYGICCMIAVESNFENVGLEAAVRSYCRDTAIVLALGIFVRFSFFKYLWVTAVCWMFYKHRLVIAREMRKVSVMNAREWALLGFIMMPLVVKMIG